MPWVQELQAEGEDVPGTVTSVMDFKYREYMPKKMKKVVEELNHSTPTPSSQEEGNSGADNDVYHCLDFQVSDKRNGRTKRNVLSKRVGFHR